MQTNNSNIVIERTSETNIVDFNEIIYCKAEGNYTRIYFQNMNIIVTKVLKCYESILPTGIFIRIHKSYIVNINFILCFKGNKRVLLKTNIELPVSRRRRSFIVKELSRSYLIVKSRGKQPLI